MCPRCGPIPRAILTFDAQGCLLSVETDAARLDSLEGIEFYSGVFVPADGTSAFEVGTCPGVVLIDRVDWETLSPTAEATRRKII